MQELVIASNNSGKISEIKRLLDGINVLSLKEIGFTQEIEEPFESFEENALQKARTIYEFCSKNVCADDSGLCVNALNGAPGVHSAYFGGLPRSDEKNNKKLLELLQGEKDRSAFYKAVICLIWEGKTYFFEDICAGNISETPVGQGGFGYDPLFVPEGYTQSFATFSPELKNRLSHRGKAVRKMLAFLKNHPPL